MQTPCRAARPVDLRLAQARIELGLEESAMRPARRLAHPLVAVLVAVAIAMVLSAPVAASTPQQVTIVSQVTFNPDGPNYGDFQADGAAVDQGLICPSGTFVDEGIRFAGFQSPLGRVQLQVVKRFTCDDGTGTFVAKLQIQADFNTGIESFDWVILGGSGAYDDVHGSGRGSTVPNPPIGNINTYVGYVID
jgi:hypothetical protein